MWASREQMLYLISIDNNLNNLITFTQLFLDSYCIGLCNQLDKFIAFNRNALFALFLNVDLGDQIVLHVYHWIRALPFKNRLIPAHTMTSNPTYSFLICQIFSLAVLTIRIDFFFDCRYKMYYRRYSKVCNTRTRLLSVHEICQSGNLMNRWSSVSSLLVLMDSLWPWHPDYGIVLFSEKKSKNENPLFVGPFLFE